MHHLPEYLIAERVDGLTLKQTIEQMLDGIVAETSRGKPRFSLNVKAVVSLYFGLEDGQRRLLKDVGMVLGISRQGAHRILHLALLFFRQPKRAAVLRAYVK